MRDKKLNSVSLAPFTTFHIGGRACVFKEAHTDTEVEEAIACAHELNLPLYPLGAGSNVLVPDEGIDGVVLKMAMNDITFKNQNGCVLLVANAGTPWEEIVDAAGERTLFGIENLAGIPGTMGGAAVQNIGAYGIEFSEVFDYADCINSMTGTAVRVSHAEASFSYRTSFFKTHRELIVMRVAIRLAEHALPKLMYPDLVRAREEEVPLNTPREIAHVIRAIRAEKFPDLTKEGSAGSFFKNPIVTEAIAIRLQERFPGLPSFPQGDGTTKISLAWILDHGLSLKGFSQGRVRLYEKQPLVIATCSGATASDVDAFALEIAERVFSATSIVIEREVETFGTAK